LLTFRVGAIRRLVRRSAAGPAGPQQRPWSPGRSGRAVCHLQFPWQARLQITVRIQVPSPIPGRWGKRSLIPGPRRPCRCSPTKSASSPMTPSRRRRSWARWWSWACPSLCGSAWMGRKGRG